MTDYQKILEGLDEIIESCREVRKEQGVHEDAKQLASYVIRDCKNLKNKLVEDFLDKKSPL
jgi:hypothetical protein